MEGFAIFALLIATVLFALLLINLAVHDIVKMLFGFSIPPLLYLLLFPLAIGLIALAVKLKRRTDIFYVLDRRDRMMYLHRRILSERKVKPVASFDRFQCVTVSASSRPHRERGTGRRWPWDYQTVLVRDSGRLILMSDRLTNFGRCNDIARDLATFIGIPFVPGWEKRFAWGRPARKSGPRVVFRRFTYMDFLIALVALTFVGILVYLTCYY